MRAQPLGRGRWWAWRGPVLALALVLVTAGGCGYGLAGRTSPLPERVRTIGIPPLVNTTTMLQIEQGLTQSLRSELIGRGRYRVVSGATGADAVLSGTVTSVTLEPVGFTDEQRAARYLFTLTMSARLDDAATDEVLWSNDALVFREEYELATRGLAELGDSVFVDQGRTAFERIARDVARTVVTSMLEAF